MMAMASSTDQIDPLESDYQAALEIARERSSSLEGPSLLEELAALDDESIERVLEHLSPVELAVLAKAWEAWARPKQRPPTLPRHRILFWLKGRGWGGTRAAAERIRERVYAGAESIALIGPNLAFIERFMLGVEGAPSGLLNVFHPRQRPVYVASPKALVRFHTGAVAYCISAETPEFRGANLDTAWCDELAQWRFLERLWTNLELATRNVTRIPLEIIVTTTPLPLRFLKELVADRDTVTILGSSTENAGNVDAEWLDRMQRIHGRTRFGRQELEAEILGDNPDSLFPGSLTDASRVDVAPELVSEVVAIDPAIATGRDNDETGILTVGSDARGHVYVTSDLSGRLKPEEWGALAIQAYEQRQCTAIVCERNRGGDLVEANVRASMFKRRGETAAKALKVVTVLATKGKYVRAEPVSSLHAQGLVHVVGRLPLLESEIAEWNPRAGGPSPNRLDSLVWAVWFLARLGEEKPDHRAGMAGLGAATQAIREGASGSRSGTSATGVNPIGALAPVTYGMKTSRRTI